MRGYGLILLDGVDVGMRDSNGIFNKFMVERRIIIILNQTRKCTKTYQHYHNRMKTLKAKYISGAELLRFSSGY